MRALVIGGTGPTGHFIVNGLRARGYAVAILHTGSHEIPEIPTDVEHIHASPFEQDALVSAVDGRSFDLCIATYGRLRRVAEVMAGRTERFFSVGGDPAYRGFMNPGLFQPAGLPTPTAEDAQRVTLESEDAKGWRIVKTEDAVFEQHPRATHFRYPTVYGPYQLLPREWCIVRRILDARPHVILPEDGLTLHHYGYAENLAHAILLAVDQPEASAGEIFNCADEELLTLRQVVEIIADELDHSWEIVSMPWSLALPARPMVMQSLPTHRVLDLSKLKSRLGYEDLVPPRDAIRRTARWLVANPPARGGQEEVALTDPFDYEAEDRLVAAWKRAMASMPKIEFATEPGYTLSYSGPGGRARTKGFD